MKRGWRGHRRIGAWLRRARAARQLLERALLLHWLLEVIHRLLEQRLG